MKKNLEAVLDEIQEENPQYRKEAYLFLLEALDYVLRQLEKPRHVSGAELLDGIRRYALNRFGPTARMVFEHWGVSRTEDFGHIVFDLVDYEVLSKTESDSLRDFVDVYDFKKVFEDDYTWTSGQELFE